MITIRELAAYFYGYLTQNLSSIFPLLLLKKKLIEKFKFLPRRKVRVEPKTSKNLVEIFKNFLPTLDISYINFIKLYQDGSVIYLCSNPSWLTHYFENNYPSIEALAREAKIFQLKYMIWSNPKKNRQGLIIIKKFKDYYDLFNFATQENDQNILNHYINNLGIFENFINYFYGNNLASILIHHNKEISKLDLAEEEIEYITYALLGKTIEEIAFILNCSRIIVKEHLEKIKTKFNDVKQFQLEYKTH
jgi:DNA-binding CsgD family transcriptional regulator